MNLRREPAVLWLALLVPIVQAVVALTLTDNATLAATVNALAVASAGAITAWQVSSDKLLPALTGLAQAVLALIVGLGVDLSPEQQAAVLAPLAILAGFVVRDRVDAPRSRQTAPPHLAA